MQRRSLQLKTRKESLKEIRLSTIGTLSKPTELATQLGAVHIIIG